MTAIDLHDVQGFILRGYRVAVARHMMLQIVQPAEARRLLGRLISGDPELPQITRASRWEHKPHVFLNLGLTATGLRALGLPDAAYNSFPRAFRLGATADETAQRVFDTGPSAPAHWIGGMGDADKIHIVLSLWSMSDEGLELAAAQLRAAFAPGLAEQSAHDARALPRNKVHFGYTDSIAQPTIAGAPPRKRPFPDAQPVAQTGEFLLGYTGDNGPPSFTITPDALSRNSSFAAFRILAQDVAGFERFLAQAAQQTGLDAELIAAKFCGRWRNGLPLSLSPEVQWPHPAVPHDQINNFTYVSADPAQDDTYGLKCPIGSHIRRTNPRNEQVVGGPDEGHHHRIVRRAIPYGPAYDPDNPEDGHERGLIGWFINADLSNQFELIMNSWANDDGFVKAVGSGGANTVKNIHGRDALFGANDPASSRFTLPVSGDPKENKQITGFGRFVTTRGGAYCYLPSITAIQYLATMPETT